MKIILTQHVKERRKNGIIPSQKLRDVAKHLILQHSLNDKDDGTYKFRNGGTQAIIAKRKNTAVFITFFGPTGYVMETTEYGNFNCQFQSSEYLKQKAERKRLKVLRKNKKEVNTGLPLNCLSPENKRKVKRNTFEIKSITIPLQSILHDLMGHRPYHILVSKHKGYSFVEILKYDGTKIKTMHINMWNNMINKTLR